MKWSLVLLSVLLVGLISSASGSQVTVSPRSVNPFGISFNLTSGSVTPAISMSLAAIGECADNPSPANVLGYPCSNGSGDDTIYFVTRGFERTQTIYVFNVQAYANATGTHTFVLRFPGIPPISVKGSTIASQAYDYTNNWLQVVFTAGTTDPAFTIRYTGVGPNIANAVTSGSGLLIALVLVIAFAFVLILIVRVKAVASGEKNDDKGLARLITYLAALLGVALVFLVILALLAVFTPYFNGIGV